MKDLSLIELNKLRKKKQLEANGLAERIQWRQELIDRYRLEISSITQKHLDHANEVIKEVNSEFKRRGFATEEEIKKALAKELLPLLRALKGLQKDELED